MAFYVLLKIACGEKSDLLVFRSSCFYFVPPIHYFPFPLGVYGSMW